MTAPFRPPFTSSGRSVVSPAPQMKRGRAMLVARPGPLAASTRFFRLALGARVEADGAAGARPGLVGVADLRAADEHGLGADVDEARHAGGAGGVEHPLRPPDVDRERLAL